MLNTNRARLERDVRFCLTFLIFKDTSLFLNLELAFDVAMYLDPWMYLS